MHSRGPAERDSQPGRMARNSEQSIQLDDDDDLNDDDDDLNNIFTYKFKMFSEKKKCKIYRTA